MVKKSIWVFLPLWMFLLCSCTVDVLGLFGSGDLNKRLEAKDEFNLLGPADRNVSPPWGSDYSFIVVGDTHIQGRNAFGLEKIIDEVTADDKFIVFCGDITQSGKREDLEKFLEIAASLSVPVYPVIGNHDVYFGNWPEWKTLIGSTRYKIDGGSANLYILDSANCYFGSEQLDWLENELAKSAGKKTFVFTHANLFVQNPSELQQFTDIRERARMVSMLKGRCDAMFMGHSHRQNIVETGGVKYISLNAFIDSKGYCRVFVKGSNVSWEFNNL